MIDVLSLLRLKLKGLTLNIYLSLVGWHKINVKWQGDNMPTPLGAK
tara:strand:- start:2623 stop:2760 length:138 start_codon:yes stop_codon:yes gene_type:complete